MIELVGFVVLLLGRSSCLDKCPQNCATTDSSEEICTSSSEMCIFGCKDGFYEPNCTAPCTDADKNCKTCVSNNNSGVICTECKRNFYQDNGRCSACNYYCLIKPEDPLPTCREKDGYCEVRCRTGRYGYRCGFRCNDLCNGACHRETGRCLTGCSDTQYCGPTCEIICQDGCVSQQCNQSCGCVKGCNTNYWGDKCQNLCNTNCIKPSKTNDAICDSTNGTCLHGCAAYKHWGNECDVTCSDGCVNGVCQQWTGNCTEGCTSNMLYGWRCDGECSTNCLGVTCDRVEQYCNEGCTKGNYGELCDKACNTNCINNTCKRENGSCNNGCITGTYGDQCETKCSGNCLESKCERVDGYCSYGCTSGYHGFQCQNVKPATDMGTRYNGLIGGTVSGWLSFAIILVVFIVVQVRRGPICKVVCFAGSNHTDVNKVEQQLENRECNEYISLQHGASYVNASAEYETLDRNREPTTSN